MKRPLFVVMLIVISLASGCASTDDDVRQSPIHLILSFSPESGPVGTIVTINGMYFSTTPSENQVSFQGAQAEVLQASVDELVVKVPQEAKTGKIAIVINGITSLSTEEFEVE